MHLAESERSVMEILWESGPTLARDVARELNTRIGWSKTTTYTMLTRCMEKGYITRTEPHFLCTAVLSKQAVAEAETEALLKNHFQGSADLLVAALVERKKLSREQMRKLCQMLEEMEEP